MCAKHGTDHEVAHWEARLGLVVDLLDELGLLRRVVRVVELLRFKDHARDTRVGRIVHEALFVDRANLLSFLLFSQRLLLDRNDLLMVCLLFLLLFALALLHAIGLLSIAIVVLLVCLWASVRIREEEVLLLVVHEDADCLEAEEARQRLLQLPEETLVVTLRADLAGEAERVDHLLLASSHLLQCMSALETHLQVEADDLKDLLVGRLEADKLLISVLSGLALDHQLDFFFLRQDRLNQVLRVLVAILDVIGRGHGRARFAARVRHAVNHSTRLKHELLMEQGAA